MRKNQGITLVALVVTIITIIILAGISINSLLGGDGILTKAKEARKAQKVAEVKEKLSSDIASAETDAILRNENLEQKQLKDIIDKYGTLQEDGDTILTKEDNYELSLKEIWYGVLSTSGSYSDKVEQVEILEKELEDLKKKYEELGNLNTTLEQTDATEDKILKNYKAYSKGNIITGTMENYSNNIQTVTTNANTGVQTYDIEDGYHTQIKIDQTATHNSKQIKSSQIVVSDMISNATNSINEKTATYEVPSDGIISYLCYACNDNGSKVYMNLNGKTLKEGTGPIIAISDTIEVKKGDKIYLYAHGVKGNTSNASALINAVFSKY